jgi:2-polyprenyl-3-methyl-5-hydroxy-6-metoxy-1,4-benzoquinol methylase
MPGDICMEDHMTVSSRDAAPVAADVLASRIAASVTAALEVLCLYLGDRLGFYQALHDHGTATAAELAARAGTNRRYTREWLEQQATAGFLACENPEAAPHERRYALPDDYAPLFVEPESLLASTPAAQVFVGVAGTLPELMRAFRDGVGVPYDHYGPDMLEGQARANRPAFTHHLAQEWVAAMPDVEARLRAEPPARVADVGMGLGWSSIALARAYPLAHIDGLDLDAASVAAARENARVMGLDSERVVFHQRNASDPELAGRYDLALAIECLHDMADPVAALRAMRQLVGPGGTVLIVDERVQDAFTPHGDDVERMMYGFSVLHCLPVSMVDQPSAATGTVMRRATFRRYATEAGFSRVDELPISHETFRFYRLTG